MDMDVSIKGSQCKVIYGPAKRVIYTTEEALGLALLGLNENNSSGQTFDWMDFLQSHGLAICCRGTKSMTIHLSPSKMRTILYTVSSSGAGEKLVMTTPPLLITSVFDNKRLVNSGMFVVKAGLEHKLSVTLQEAVLAHFPYGNVHNHGGICWGHAATADIKNPIDVEESFFNSAFNHDLFDPASCGVVDASLGTMVKRTEGILPSPVNFRVSIDQIIQGMGR